MTTELKDLEQKQRDTECSISHEVDQLKQMKKLQIELKHDEESRKQEYLESVKQQTNDMQER